jgi:cation diffusion facilitator family transporter
MVGKLSGSVSIIADAFNNLTDAGTVCLAGMGIKIAGLGSGEKHPDGHGRFEWIIALITSLSVCLVGWELMRDSIDAIHHPNNTNFSWVTFFALLMSIIIKIFLYYYNAKKSKSEGLLSLKAVAMDSLSDAISTSAVLLSLLLNEGFGWKLDGWFGVAVALLIMYNAFKSCSESIELLLGKAASKEEMEELTQYVKELCNDKIQICSPQIADYGYGRKKAFLTILPRSGDTIQGVVREIPYISLKLKNRFGYEVFIQVEEPIEEQTEKNIIHSFVKKMDQYEVKYEVREERVINMSEDKKQLKATVLIPWWDKKIGSQLEEMYSKPELFGLSETDSVIIKLKYCAINDFGSSSISM